MAANRNDRNDETGLSDLIRKEIGRGDNPTHLAHLPIFAPQRGLPARLQALLAELDRAEDETAQGAWRAMRNG